MLATAILLILTCFWRKSKLHKNFSPTVLTEDEQKHSIEMLNTRKPLLLAKMIEDQLPTDTKLSEKRYIVTLIEKKSFISILFNVFSRAETEQLQAIYNHMKKHSEFADITMEDMKNQLHLYGF